MCTIIGLIGVLSLVLAIIHLFYPEGIKQINDLGKKAIELHEIAEKNRVVFGVFYLLAAIALFYVGFIKQSI